MSGSHPKKSPTASATQHHPYPQAKKEKPIFDSSKTKLGKLFSQGNATAKSLPAFRKKDQTMNLSLKISLSKFVC